MPTGTVKWFNDQKGYGFILDSENRDVFVHYAVIEGTGYRSLVDGEPVEYDAEESGKGLKATRVKRLSPPERPRRQQVPSGNQRGNQRMAARP